MILRKTYLAAFDFIAHRENILRRARESFGRVMGNPDFGAVLGGGNGRHPEDQAVFAMIQTLSRENHLRDFSPDAFDYIVVDEFHHGRAESYRRVLAHFRPRFLLGLTATPERMDGRDVLALCDYNIAYEVRLLEENGGCGLRRAPGKNFLVALDFVVNFRKVHVAPLALMGFTSVDQYVEACRQNPRIGIGEGLPEGCYLNAELDIRRIWDEEIRVASGEDCD
jgi:superfamily II DNA or RNA helicase